MLQILAASNNLWSDLLQLSACDFNLCYQTHSSFLLRLQFCLVIGIWDEFSDDVTKAAVCKADVDWLMRKCERFAKIKYFSHAWHHWPSSPYHPIMKLINFSIHSVFSFTFAFFRRQSHRFNNNNAQALLDNGTHSVSDTFTMFLKANKLPNRRLGIIIKS